MTTVRRTKWRPTLPPQPSPRIIQLPSRRIRRKPHETFTKKHSYGENYKGTLSALFDQEAPFSRSVPIVRLNSGNHKPRERVKQNVDDDDEEFIEEKWRFQAEILRAECNFLRMEREVALQKFERNHFHIETILRSAIQTLVSGRKMIKEEKKANEVLGEVIEELIQKLKQLQRKSMVDRDFELRKCSNFDKEATLLRRKLEKIKLGSSSSPDDNRVNEIRNLAETSLSISTAFFSDVEILRAKMEGLSKGMLERVEEECGSIGSASTWKRTESADSSSSSTSTRQPCQEMSCEEMVCSGHCKVIVQRIAEQVRAEKEQWSQMQAMLGQVKQEMEELQASRDFWETRALDSDFQAQSLHSTAQEWRQKSLSLETKTNELQNKISSLGQELEMLRRANVHSSVLQDQQHEKEKRVLVCRLKENHGIKGSNARQKERLGDGRRNSFLGNTEGVAALKRSPFRDVGNLSPLLREKGKVICPL